jgi:cytochrome c-type biogenesis protein CcmE
VSKRLLALSLCGTAAVLFVVFGLDRPRVVHALPVSRFMARPLLDRTVRVSGQLVRGSLCRVSEPCEYRFRLEEGGQSLQVSHPACTLPDTLRDAPGYDVEVQVEGELCGNCHAFESSSVLAKGPGKYWMTATGHPLPAAPIPECPLSAPSAAHVL